MVAHITTPSHMYMAFSFFYLGQHESYGIKLCIAPRYIALAMYLVSKL